MLEIVKIENPNDKRDIFLNTDLSKASWVVSDLTSKIAFKKELFKKQDLVPDEAILRAHELWMKWIQRLRGDLRFIPHDAALILTKDMILNSKTAEDEEWKIRPGVPRLLHNYLQTLMPLLSHNENHEAMKEFFKNHIDSYGRWGSWYLLSHEVYNVFIQQKMILSTWSSSILVNELGFERVWDRKLVFDLGAQLQPIESELIKHISKFLDVVVLMPTPSWSDKYQRVLKSYDGFFFEEIKEKSSGRGMIAPRLNGIKYERFTTQLAEVQDVISKIRIQIEKENKKSEEIAIAAPDMSLYWPILLEYFKIEGIPYQRKVMAPLKNFPEIALWISRLKIESGGISYSDLEINAFESQREVPLRYEEFKSLFTNIFRVQDIERSQSVRELFFMDLKEMGKGPLNLQMFIKWALGFFPKEGTQERLRQIIDRLFTDIPLSSRFQLKDWVELLDQVSGRLEVTLEEGFEEGVHCVDLISLKDLDISFAHIMGLSDQALRRSSSVLLSEKDIFDLKNELGFLVAEPENTDLEFEVLWNLENKKINFHLTAPQTDFDGGTLSSSIVWMRGAYEQSEEGQISTQIPGVTRLQRIQELNLKEIPKLKDWSEEESQSRLLRVEQDLGNKIVPWKISDPIQSLSASQIEDYLSCPFINASKKLFSLKDLPDLDLDMDYQTKGNLLHGVAEYLFKNYPNLEVKEEELSEVFDKVRKNIQFKLADENLWVPQKQKYMKMIERFLAFEKNWRTLFKNIISEGQETSFEVYIEPDSGKILLEPNSNTIRFKGRIDRIDMDLMRENCVVIDYKHSLNSSNHHSHNVWIEKNELQLALYSMAIEKGILGKPIRVAGAVYYSFKDQNREKGFLDEEFNGELFKVGGKKHKIDLQGKNELFKKVEGVLVETIQKMKDGEYNPNPSDKKDCEKCKWRDICRAPHLI